MRYFVSGHRDLTKEEFEKYYVPKINYVIANEHTPVFIVGDWEGCDTMFLEYLNTLYLRLNFPWAIKVIIYFCKTVRITSNYIFNINNIEFHQKSTYDECDEAMTRNSDFDIAWIRPGREDSHTAKNIKRRYGFYK